nr:rhomboid family intramembrane serine protease [Opitutales bacterium]
VLRDQPLTFLFFFILPVRLRPRTLLAITAGFEVLGFLTQELAGYGMIANSAHLGGFLGGYLVYISSQRGFDFGKMIRKQWKEYFPRKSTVQSDSYSLYIAKNASQRQEIDRILDKINTTGFQSLTPGERDTLESAKQLMHR